MPTAALARPTPLLWNHSLPVFAAGMSIEEAGRRMVAGVSRGDFWIFTHGEYQEDFAEIAAEVRAALPVEDFPPERLAVEEQRRKANRESLERRTGLGDMVVE